MEQGDETPIGYGIPINTTNEIYSGAKLHPVRGKQLHLLSGNQINAIIKVTLVDFFRLILIEIFHSEHGVFREGRNMARFFKKEIRLSRFKEVGGRNKIEGTELRGSITLAVLVVNKRSRP